MGVIVLDAGVVIALLERHDVHHAAARQAVASARDQGDQLFLSAATYSEILVHPAGQGAAAIAAVDGIIDALPSTIVPIDRTIAAAAAGLRARHGGGLRLPDAMVLATAEVIAADRVITTDARLTRRGVEIELIGGH